MEEWKPVKDFPEYMISNQGRIAKILATQDFRGYRVLNLTKDNQPFHKRIHRLVAEAFLPPGDESQTTIDHIDRDKSNNRVENLRWASQQEQMINQNLRSKLSLIKKDKNLFRVYIVRKGKAVIDKRFKTEEEAIEYRDAYLQSEKASCGII